MGQIAVHTEPALVALLGRAAGRRLHALAHNRDPRRVRARRGRRSFGAQSALGRRARSPEALEAVLAALVDRVTRRMRAKRRLGRTVTLRLRFGDYSRVSRSHTLAVATASTRPVLLTARALLAAAGPSIEQRGLTLIGVSIANLERGTGAAQLALAVDPPDHDALDASLDRVRERFGPAAVTRASLIGADDAPSTWLFPGEDADA